MGSGTDMHVGKTTSGSVSNCSTIMLLFTDLVTGVSVVGNLGISAVLGYGSVQGIVGVTVNVSGYVLLF